MIRRTSQTITAWFVVWDLALTALAWLGSYWLRFDSGLIPFDPEIQPDFVLYLGTVPLILLLARSSPIAWRGCTRSIGCDASAKNSLAVVKGIGLMALAVMATSFARHSHYESRIAMVMFVGAALFDGVGRAAGDVEGGARSARGA